MNLDLSREEIAALTQLLSNTIDRDRYPLSPRIQTFKSILAKSGRRQPDLPTRSEAIRRLVTFALENYPRADGRGTAVTSQITSAPRLGLRLNVKAARGIIGGRAEEARNTLIASAAQISPIDQWRIKQRPIPSRNEAIRRLVDRGREAEGEQQTK